MQRLSISEFSSYRWNFFQDVIKYSKIGIQAIGVWRCKIDEFGYESAADLLHEMQMSVTSLSWAGGFTGSDGNSHRLAIDDALEAVYQAHMIGADKLIIYPGSRNGHTESHALRLVKTGIESILPQAHDLGVKLVIEPILTSNNPFSFMERFESYLDFLNQFCPNRVGLVLDLFHVGRNQHLLTNFSRVADRVALVQLSDGHYSHGEFVRCNLGRGVIPIGDWLDLLDDYNFDGDLEIEVHGSEFESCDYLDTINRNREYVALSLGRVQSGTTS